MTFRGIPLVISSSERRASRSQLEEASTINEIRRRCFNRFGNFLDDLLSRLEGYFIPFPQWLELSETLFLFTKAESEPHGFHERMDFRTNQFDEILELEHSHTSMSIDKKMLLRAEFKTLTIKGFELVAPILEAGTPKALKHINSMAWYKICTEERHYRGLEEVIDYAFRFLLRDCNECTVESTIGDIDYVKGGKGSRRTRLTYTNHHEQMFIRKNGPPALLSADLRKQALDRVFREQDCWNFLVSRKLASMQSALVAHRLKKAK